MSQDEYDHSKQHPTDPYLVWNVTKQRWEVGTLPGDW
jgi:hypothetical protein